VTKGSRTITLVGRILDRRSVLPWALAGAGILLVGYFDLQTNFPFLDEYARRWTIQRLADGHGLVFWGSSPNLVELAVAMPLALLHTEPRFFRLAGLPFLAMGAVFSWLIARRLGADRFWSATAAAVVVVSPIGLALATGIMTETAFIALLLAATWFSLRWVSEGKGIGWAIAFAVLATLQREQGIGVAITITLGLLLLRGDRAVTRRDWLGLAALWLVSLAALVSVQVYRRLGPTTFGEVAPATSPVVSVVVAIAALVIIGAFVLLPFAVAMLPRPVPERAARGRIEILPVVMAAFALSFAGVGYAMLNVPFFIGYMWGAKGLSISREAGKPDLLPLALFVLVEALTVITVVILLVWRRRAWRLSIIGAAGGVLVVAALVQFSAIIVTGQVFDRYYLPVLAPVIPLMAALACRSSPRTWGAAWATATLAASLGLYVVGEQDFQAWIGARDQAAQAAYAQAQPSEVQAGFEETALHIWIPAVENPGAGLPQQVSSHPRLALISAGPDDPRPGFSYSSIAPGKIVIVVLPAGSGP
jgi:hypothetical protein